MMRTFNELRASQELTRADDAALGPVYWTRSGVRDGGRVRVFEHPQDVGPYVAMHEYAHLWIHRDYDHDAWLVLDVDEPIEVGVDFVIMPRRVGNTLESFVRADDPAQPPPRLGDLRAVVPKLVAAATDPADVWIANVVANRLAGPDLNTIYVWGEERFYIQDLAPSREELAAWQSLQRASDGPGAR